MTSQELKVYARVKPINGGDTSDEVEVKQSDDGTFSLRARNVQFVLDGAFNGVTTQQAVYDMVAAEQVDGLMQGYSAAIMAYGQTGSGKTHTLYGPDNVLKGNNLMRSKDAWGIVPRVCEHLFKAMEAKRATTDFDVQISYVEVYNDTLNDLLGGARNMKMFEDKKKGVSVEGLTLHPVRSAQQAIETIWAGSNNRIVAEMAMNARSSRGHSIVSLHVEATSKVAGVGGTRTGKLSMVDLAGMESSKKSSAVGASDGPERKEEAKHINTSLVSLANVIDKMAKADKGGHVPWRDSKLTRLLQDTLTGGGKSAIIVTIRQEPQNVDEGIATLRFARTAKTVQVTVNRALMKLTPEQADRLLATFENTVEEMEKAKAENARLRKALESGGQLEDLKIANEENKKLRKDKAALALKASQAKPAPPRPKWQIALLGTLCCSLAAAVIFFSMPLLLDAFPQLFAIILPSDTPFLDKDDADKMLEHMEVACCPKKVQSRELGSALRALDAMQMGVGQKEEAESDPAQKLLDRLESGDADDHEDEDGTTADANLDDLPLETRIAMGMNKNKERRSMTTTATMSKEQLQALNAKEVGITTGRDADEAELEDEDELTDEETLPMEEKIMRQKMRERENAAKDGGAAAAAAAAQERAASHAKAQAAGGKAIYQPGEQVYVPRKTGDEARATIVSFDESNQQYKIEFQEKDDAGNFKKKHKLASAKHLRPANAGASLLPAQALPKPNDAELRQLL